MQLYGVVHRLSVMHVTLLFLALSPVDEYLRELRNHIGKQWKALARELGFYPTDIDAIEHDNPLQLKEQIHKFIVKWKNREGRNASTEKLRCGLIEADLYGVQRSIEEKMHMCDRRLQRLGSSGINATTPSPTTSGDAFSLSFSFNTAAVSRQPSLPPLPIQESADVDTDSPLKNKQPNNSQAGSDCTSADFPTDQHDAADSPLEVGDAVMVRRVDAAPWYGVIKYLGDLSGTGKMIAGLDLVSLMTMYSNVLEYYNNYEVQLC